MWSVIDRAMWPALLGPLLCWLALDALLIWRLSRPDRKWYFEALALFAGQGIAIWLMAAFFTTGQIGGGDSYNYSLQLADFLTQLRHGVFPVFVGQSDFAFNGNVHTVRTAPYFLHLAAALHLLTAGKLPIAGLLNLTLITSVLGGVTSAYASVRLLASNWRGAATMLAALYLLCPAIMVILTGMDMYASIMTLPWLPIFWLGIAGTLMPGTGWRPLLQLTASSALIWYAHPAVAIWITPFWAGALATRLLLVERTQTQAARTATVVGALGVLLTYLFVSVSTLDLGYSKNALGAAAVSIVANLEASWAGSWLPLVAPAGRLSNIQLGYALAALALVGLVGVRRAGLPGKFIAVAAVALLFLLTPVPKLALLIWRSIPDEVIDATNVWPMQRFYPILAAAIPIWVALLLRTWTPKWSWRGVTTLALAALAAWSVAQQKVPRERAVLVRQNPVRTADLLRPVNVSLGRGSYLLFDFYPSYYSHGVAEPTFETRFLDGAMNPIVENGPELYRFKSGTQPVARLKCEQDEVAPADVKQREATFKTDGHSQYLLAFDFGSAPSGIIELIGAGFYRMYTLPESGSVHAFGAGPGSTHYLPLALPPDPPVTILLQTDMKKVSAKVYAFKPSDLPIKTKSLVPLSYSLTAPRAGYLETPRVFIPGYAATVNGVPTPVVRSKERLVAVALPPGPAEVVVSYPGPLVLRLAYWFSAIGAVLFGALCLWLGCRDDEHRPRSPPYRRDTGSTTVNVLP